ncbi:FKBP-type peptidyl-prolyl cis-trans isomerase [Dongshaea marina]|uniref:FKBP-type peptidyl-prolyl cis-trans isomerase n=1 Tax=Dongshaea marina TaxID=2047966 RepID=UPI000D3ED332|nr:peptidylprolyl isomerase [Dongshaea marina]
MKVSEQSVVTLHYSVSDKQDELLDSNMDGQPLIYLHGSGMLVPGLEQAITGRVRGDSFSVELEPAQAYGEYVDGLRQQIPGDVFDGMEVAEGDRFMAQTDDGDLPVTVVEVATDYVVVDGNHPLAGEPLKFEVMIKDVREATEEELAHGHVHGAGGCGHHHEEHHGCGGHGKGDDHQCCGGKGGHEGCCGGKGH